MCEKLIGLGSWKEEIRRSLVLLFRGAVTVVATGEQRSISYPDMIVDGRPVLLRCCERPDSH